MHNRDDVEEVAEERRAKQLLADAERARRFAEDAPRRRPRPTLLDVVLRRGRGQEGS